MTLRERWIALPWDLQMGWAAGAALVMWFMWGVLTGPGLFMLASWCLLFPLLVVMALIVLLRLSLYTPRKPRVLLLVAISACLAITAHRDAIVDLHLVCRIYMAGGPRAINGWAQDLMREQEGKGEARHIEAGEIPPSIRSNLPGWVSVGGTLWSDNAQVRIELGGGFYHYGVVVYPTGAVASGDWWLRIIGWPPEVDVYHEE